MTTPINVQTVESRVVEPDEGSLSRAVIYRFLSYAYQYPSLDILSCLRTLVTAVEEAFSSLGGDGGLSAQTDLAALKESLDTEILESVEEDWILLFGHSAQGTCPPYEGEYTESEEGLQQPHELGDLSAFYRAFGLQVGVDTHERSDFVGVELAYLSFLCQKQAYAEEIENTELTEHTVRAQTMFLRDHLGRWAPAFTRRILDLTDRGFFRHLAAFTLSYVTQDCRRLNVEPGSIRLRVRKVNEGPEDYMDCPMSTAGNKLEPE